MPWDANYVEQMLVRKREYDPRLVGLGVKKHKYRLLPPTPASDVSRLEELFDIDLPDDYREFIIAVGGGGVGPGHGLYTLEGALTGKDPTYGRHGEVRTAADVSANFARPKRAHDSNDRSEAGMLRLCQHGCGTDDYLVLVGPDKGTIWTYHEELDHMIPNLKNPIKLRDDDDFSDLPYSVVSDRWANRCLDAPPSEQMTFADWYHKWLLEPTYMLPHPSPRKRH